jgi:hypothetical protein
MGWVWLLFSLPFCIAIAVQDFKSRMVSTGLIAGLAFWLFTERLMAGGNIWPDIIINSLVVLLMFLLLSAYGLFRFKTINITNNMIGIGDWALMLAFIPTLACMPYLFFLVSGFLTGLIYVVLAGKTKKDHQRTVPLAGMLCLWYPLFMTILHIWGSDLDGLVPWFNV